MSQNLAALSTAEKLHRLVGASQLERRVELLESAAERLSIEMVGFAAIDDIAKRLDFFEEQLQKVSDKLGIPW